MKKYLIALLIISLMMTGCVKEIIKKRNYLDVKWTLDEELKPEIEFDRSKKNDAYGIFYVDETQVKYEEFIKYLEKLEEKEFKVDWRYSDTDSIAKLKEKYEKKGEIFKDNYINYKVCKDNICIFMQWVNKEEYNKTNKEKPVTYSFKLETEKLQEEKKED